MSVDKKVRRHLLKPLQRRPSNSFSRKNLAAALQRLDQRASGELLLPGILKLIPHPSDSRSRESWKDPIAARRSIKLIRALFLARRISRQEYFFYALSLVEGIHEGRILDGAYERELGPIVAAIDEIEKHHGLTQGEYWAKGTGPNEHETLNKKYENVLDDLFNAALAEFDLHELGEFRKSDATECNRLRERGRRTVFHNDEFKEALQDVVRSYERDAKRAASAGAYSAAITLLGAGLEGLLLLRCMRSKKKAERVASRLPSRVRPRKTDDLSNWRFETLIETCLAAKWLPALETDTAQYNPAGLAHLLRRMRN